MDRTHLLERTDLLERLAAGPVRTADAARRVAAAEAARGTGPGEWTPREWSPREVVAHLAGVEAQVFQARLDQLAAGESPVWAWTEPEPSTDPAAASLDGALGLFAAAREATVARVTGLDDAGWERAGTHVTYGRLDVDGLLRVACDHDDEHLAGLEARAT